MSAGFLLIHAKPGRRWTMVLSWTLFVAGIAGYLWVSQQRHTQQEPTAAGFGVLPEHARQESLGLLFVFFRRF